MINWKLRLKNKTTLVALVTGIIAFVYQVLSIFDITPSISESELTNTIGMLINVLVLMGVVVDPTTSGLSDSDKAMTYVSPSTNYEELGGEDTGDSEEEHEIDDPEDAEVE